MICKKCGFNNSDSDDFCRQCGIELENNTAALNNDVETEIITDVDEKEITELMQVDEDEKKRAEAEKFGSSDFNVSDKIMQYSNKKTVNEPVAENYFNRCSEQSEGEDCETPSTEKPEPLIREKFTETMRKYSLEAGKEPSAESFNDEFTVEPFAPNDVKSEADEAEDTVRVERKKVVIGALLALAAIVVLSVFISFVNNLANTNHSTIFMEGSNGKTIALYDGKPVDGSIDAMLLYSLEADDGSACLAVTVNNELYAANKDGIEKVGDTDELLTKISSNGDTLIYQAEDALYLYYIKNGEKEKICDNADFYSIIMSPDGKTVAYNKENDEKLYLYEGGANREIDSNVKCIGLSDKAKYLYAVDFVVEPILDAKAPIRKEYDTDEEYDKAHDKYEEELEKFYAEQDKFSEQVKAEQCSLYLYPSGNDDKVIEIGEADTNCIWKYNNDLSEILFTNEQKTYYSKKGEDPIKLCDETIVPTCSYAENINLSFDANSWVYPNDSFLTNIYYDNETMSTLYYIDRNGERDKLEDDLEGNLIYGFSDNVLYYLDNDNLYMIDIKSPEDRKKIAKDVQTFDASENGETLYYLDNNNKLYKIEDGRKKEKIDRDVEGFCLGPNGGVYYLSDYRKRNGGIYTLYYAKDDKGVKISKDVNELLVSGKCVMYLKDGDEKSYKYEIDGEATESSQMFYDCYVSENCNEDFDTVYKNYTPSDVFYVTTQYYSDDSYNYDDDYDDDDYDDYEYNYDDYDYDDDDYDYDSYDYDDDDYDYYGYEDFNSSIIDDHSNDDDLSEATYFVTSTSKEIQVDEAPIVDDASYVPDNMTCGTLWIDLTEKTNFEFNGSFMVYEFKIKENAPSGVYPITISTCSLSDYDAKLIYPYNVSTEIYVSKERGSGAPMDLYGLTILADATDGVQGDTVQVTFDMLNNPGITAMDLNFEYDSNALELVYCYPVGEFANIALKETVSD